MQRFEETSSWSVVMPFWASAETCQEERRDEARGLINGLVSTAEAAGVAPMSLLLSAMARRDRRLVARARRTAEWARLLGEAVGSESLAADAHDVALLADVGQLALPEVSPSNPWQEWQRRRAAYDVLQAIPSLAHLAQPVLTVSERFDGAGLPFGWQGAEIPLTARIARLTRDFDLASHGWWPGHPAGVSARACMELVTLAGQTVDPALVHAWLRVLDREVAADVA
ncbi:MAG TPA: HD domain-containing phosphohydrolase [Luteitalea sp.]|nr:HD domain-containing phosphohydrolase [Luteitalea sp.]